MTYNCEEKAIIIPLIDEPSISVTTLYVTDTCCGTPKGYTYCNPDNKTNLLNASFTIDNLVQTKEEPEFPCYIEMTWDEELNIDVTDVTSFVGTKETYIDGVLTLTENLDLTYFNTVHNVYTYFDQADRSYTFNLEFTLSNGIVITYVMSYHTNVDYFSDAICSIIDFSNTVTSDYDCLKELSIEIDGVHFPIDLTDGFYSVTWTTYEGCFVVECDETLACKVKNFIESIFNSTCYHCNKEKNLETSMKILMYYKAFLSDCLDCCEKCNAYEKIIDIINGCKDC